MSDQQRLVFWHELKGPAGTLSSLLDVLADSFAADLPEEARDLLVRARRQAARMGELIAAGHDVERLSAGKLVLEHAAIDLVKALDQALAAAEPLAATRKVTIAPVETGQGGQALADPIQLPRCLCALARAAVEACAKGGRVRPSLTVNPADGVVRLVIEPPVTPTTLAEAFSPESTLGMRGGGGFGLAQARSLAQAMGGSVQVDGEALVCRLPLSPPRG